MKRTCILLIPTTSGIVFDETLVLVESLLGKLNIDTSDEGLAFITNLSLSEDQKQSFSKELEEKGLNTLFIESDEDLLDKISSKNTLDLTKCYYSESKKHINKQRDPMIEGI